MQVRCISKSFKLYYVLGMKYIEDEKLQHYTAQLTSQTLGINKSRIINGRIEAFSCKRGTTEKRAAKKLHERYSGQQMIDASVVNASSNGNGTSRRLYTDFILTLNASFPDYDFSHMTPQSFKYVVNTGQVIQIINEHIGEICGVRGAGWLGGLWEAINDVINLEESEVYSFVIDDDFGVDNEQCSNLWDFQFFFFNRIVKRIVFFSANCKHIDLLQESNIATNLEVCYDF